MIFRGYLITGAANYESLASTAMSRTLSLLIGGIAYVGPAIWAFFAIEADRKAQLSGHGFVCGNPMLGIICLAGILSAVFSLVATGFSVASYRGIPGPRPNSRVFELGILLLPFLIAGGFVGLLLLG